mgnify:FL=1
MKPMYRKIAFFFYSKSILRNNNLQTIRQSPVIKVTAFLVYGTMFCIALYCAESVLKIAVRWMSCFIRIFRKKVSSKYLQSLLRGIVDSRQIVGGSTNRLRESPTFLLLVRSLQYEVGRMLTEDFPEWPDLRAGTFGEPHDYVRKDS